jgi:hypothetical protein
VNAVHSGIGPITGITVYNGVTLVNPKTKQPPPFYYLSTTGSLPTVSLSTNQIVRIGFGGGSSSGTVYGNGNCNLYFVPSTTLVVDFNSLGDVAFLNGDKRV